LSTDAPVTLAGNSRASKLQAGSADPLVSAGHSSQSNRFTAAHNTPLHITSWPYLDIVSALMVGGHLLSLVRWCSTLCQMIYEIL